ncbi:hypothetical protein V6N11_059080 [Hibiscus sabdariffa]|uniref:Uncharacterized protein n=1 Tax=Hibiscus sabdariffa TaxID=183260 RepID=A0ABR2U634_9ROSI
MTYFPLLCSGLRASSLKPQALLCSSDKLLPIIYLKLSNRILINGIHHEKNFTSFLLEFLQEWGVLHCLLALSGDIINVFFSLFHSGDSP